MDMENRQESDLMEQMRKQMQINSENFSARNFGSMSQFLNNGSGGNDLFTNTNGVDGGVTIIQGQSRNKGEHTQVLADSRSATIQGNMNQTGEQQQLPPWIEEKLRKEGLLNGNQKITATATQKKISIANSSCMGVTRSFSSNSGFPMPSSSNSFTNMNQQLEKDGRPQDGVTTVVATRNSPMGVPLSPRRSPFTFRNFEGPLWTDNIFPLENDLLKQNRKTWDLSSDLQTRTQVHFSASHSQQVFESSSNGSFR